MSRKQQLEEQIEQLRRKMYELNKDDAKQVEIIRTSQHLDALFNQYSKLEENEGD